MRSLTLTLQVGHCHALCAAVLDLADSLQHVVWHLDSGECQNLRNTCKLLRSHPAVVGGIEVVHDGAREQQGLRHLTGLQHLCLESPPSLFHLQHLKCLTKLIKVNINDASVVDLTPLSVIPSLRSLILQSCGGHTGLDSLLRLEDLQLNCTAATPALLYLTALTRLHLGDSTQAVSLGQLSHLVAFSLSCGYAHDEWTADETAALFAPGPAGIPALRDLSCSHEVMPPLASMGQLTALDIDCERGELPTHLQDLRQLTGLVKLGISVYTGQPEVMSDSITTLFLVVDNRAIDNVCFPDLSDCSALEDVMLMVYLEGPDARLHIRAEQLGPRLETLWLDQLGGEVFLDVEAAKELQVQRVHGLRWFRELAEFQDS